MCISDSKVFRDVVHCGAAGGSSTRGKWRCFAQCADDQVPSVCVPRNRQVDECCINLSTASGVMNMSVVLVSVLKIEQHSAHLFHHTDVE